MMERRRGTRRLIFARGKISFNSGYSTKDCVVRNVGVGGAYLDFNNAMGIPNSFALNCKLGGLTIICDCEVLRRKGNSVAVRLV